MYFVYNNIFLKFLKLNIEKDFEEQLRLVISNQITIKYILSIQVESIKNIKVYNKRNFIIACLVQFYIQINYYYTLFYIYQSTNSKSNQLTYSLYKNMQFFNIKSISNIKLKYYLNQSLVLYSQYLYYIILFIQKILDYKLLTYASSKNQINAIKVVVAKLRLAIYQRIF